MNNRMRIILCKGQLYGPISGSDETLVTYATQLQRAGHSVSVLLMFLHNEQDQYYRRLLDAGIPVSWMASSLAHTSMGAGRRIANKVFDVFPASKQFIRNRAQRVVTGMAGRFYGQCRSFFQEQNADLIHVITPDPSAMVMIRAGHDAGIPVIYQELGIPYHPPHFESYYKQFTSVLPLCSEIAALSPTLKQHCHEKLPVLQALSILPIMSDEPANGSDSSSRMTDSITFGFAARMEELKGPMILMEAFGVTHQECRNIQLNIAGDGSQRETIARRAEDLGVSSGYKYRGVYHTPQDCRAFMKQLDVFIMPSFTEGTPNSIVEAMACGKPTIASDVGGIPDMVGEDAGVLVPPGDPAALANAMTLLAQNPELRTRMGEAARTRYEKIFSPQVVMPLMLDTYRRVAGNGHRIQNGNGTVHPWAKIPH
jgi:glycosyltransferase involved in cell wall biosynthesis